MECNIDEIKVKFADLVEKHGIADNSYKARYKEIDIWTIGDGEIEIEGSTIDGVRVYYADDGDLRIVYNRNVDDMDSFDGFNAESLAMLYEDIVAALGKQSMPSDI